MSQQLSEEANTSQKERLLQIQLTVRLDVVHSCLSHSNSVISLGYRHLWCDESLTQQARGGKLGLGEGSLLCMEIYKEIPQDDPFTWRRKNLGDPFSIPDSSHRRAPISLDNSTTREKRIAQCDGLWKAPEAFFSALQSTNRSTFICLELEVL